MGLLWRRRDSEPSEAFEWREIVCSSEEAAAAEAARRQLDEDPDEVEWVYLHNERTGQWIARRGPTHLTRQSESTQSFWESLIGALIG